MTDESESFERAFRLMRQVEIFNQVPKDVIETLCRNMIISRFKPEQRIINQGDKGNSMYIILSGRVMVHDHEFVFADMHEGNFFGEFSLLDDEPRSLSVTAVTQSVMGSILQKDFYNILQSFPAVRDDIIKLMLKRLRNQNGNIIRQLRQRQKELEQQVSSRTQDLQRKNTDLETTLDELKKTQEQLIQQEKLASLGQLTAGIAHEIKNPLNFVNNFALLSNTILEDYERTDDENEKKELMQDLKQNLDKIHYHGQRANNIIKSMLDHARVSSHSKQLTNLNVLCEEYLNIAYHGSRANNPEFNCKIVRRYDETLPQIECIPQDLSRVFLNLFNNAFYAITGKTDGQLTVTTALSRDKSNVIITVEDNGSGIAENNLVKIFQPFFTTKPTGQGTGLGLSISFDIVKAHGGMLSAESKEGAYTIFTIMLPVRS